MNTKQIHQDCLIGSLLCHSDEIAGIVAPMMLDKLTDEERRQHEEFMSLSRDEKDKILHQDYLDVLSSAEAETKEMLIYLLKKYPTEAADLIQSAPKEVDWMDMQNYVYGKYLEILEARAAAGL